MQFETDAIRFGYHQSNVNEHSEAIFPTSSFTFASAEEAAKAFAGEIEANIYSRFTNPTIDAFATRLAQLEGAEDGVATASGMAAIFITLLAKLQAGDHFVASKSMFGTTIVLINNFIKNYGIKVSWVELAQLEQWQDAIQTNTKLFLLESPSNPRGEVVDLAALSAISKEYNILLAVDNAIMTPYLQQPLKLGADIVIHSATKYIDGQGRTLAGAIVGSVKVMENIRALMRSAGATISPFNAWLCLKGLETLSLRMQKHCENALALATHLQKYDVNVNYLGLNSHPHHQLASTQQRGFGAILTLDVGSRARAFELINNTGFFSITANLGDAKTTITHPATTTHGRISQEERDKTGITEGLIRISVGLEHSEDIIQAIKL